MESDDFSYVVWKVIAQVIRLFHRNEIAGGATLTNQIYRGSTRWSALGDVFGFQNYSAAGIVQEDCS